MTSEGREFVLECEENCDDLSQFEDDLALALALSASQQGGTKEDKKKRQQKTTKEDNQRLRIQTARDDGDEDLTRSPVQPPAEEESELIVRAPPDGCPSPVKKRRKRENNLLDDKTDEVNLLRYLWNELTTNPPLFIIGDKKGTGGHRCCRRRRRHITFESLTHQLVQLGMELEVSDVCAMLRLAQEAGTHDEGTTEQEKNDGTSQMVLQVFQVESPSSAAAAGGEEPPHLPLPQRDCQLTWAQFTRFFYSLKIKVQRDGRPV